MTIDVNDFIKERGGDPNKIRESQRRRYAPEAVVDEVIAMFEDHRKSERLRKQSGEHLGLTVTQHSTKQRK
jgi:hypothetical protein